MNPEEYQSYDALGLADLVARREVSAGELLDAAIAQIEARNPDINAVVNRLYDQARAQIDGGLGSGPFAGVPFLLKDLGVALAGVVASGGSRFFADARASQDSTLVRRYKAAGLVLCGKTNTPELGLACTTEPVLFGPTRNPHDTAHSPGGSSGGAAAAVAAGMVPAAHASDGGGSIRIPASACGLVGLKPTRGRVPLGPAQTEGWGGLSTAHVVTRTVRDSAALLDATRGEEVGAPYCAPAETRSYLEAAGSDPRPLRIALNTRAFTGAATAAEVGAAAEAAARLCESLGHRVEEAAPAIDQQAFKDAHGIIALCHTAAMLEARAQETGVAVSEQVVERLTWRNYRAAGAIPGPAYAWAQGQIRSLSMALAGFFEHYDLLLSPTMACLPPKLGELDTMSDDDVGYLRLLYEMIGFTALFNDAGNPAISLPLARSATGLPIGVQFGAAFGDEHLLYQLSGQLERAGAFSR
ncbi:MAG: amidase [Pseudomonadales bacterium]